MERETKRLVSAICVVVVVGIGAMEQADSTWAKR